jgi:DNA-binding transcriptional LysR family regulator
LPPIESLRCFALAAGTLNFRVAAAEAALSPPAFSQRIRQLEDFVGAKLFTRSTRRVQLTDPGRRLLEEAEKILVAIGRWPDLAADTDSPIKREMILGTRHELGLSWVSPLLLALEKAVPGLTLQLYFGSGPDLVARTLDGRLDAAITSSRLPDQRLATSDLHTERYVWVTSPEKARRRAISSLEGIASECLIDISPELPLARYWLEGPDGDPHLRFGRLRFVGTIGAVRALLLEGEGVAVLPEYFVAEDIRLGRLRRIARKHRLLEDCFRLIYSPDHGDRRVLEALAGELRTHPLQ